MSRRKRRTFTADQKLNAVSSYLGGRKTVNEIATELDVAVGQIYRWKADLEEKERSRKVAAIQEQGIPLAVARKIQQQQEEIEAYQKKVAEQAVIIDLLKKLRNPQASQSGSELNGWIDISKKSDQKRKPAK